MIDTTPGPATSGTPGSRRPPWAGLPLRLLDLVLIIALAAGTVFALRHLLPPSGLTTERIIVFLIGQNIAMLCIIGLVAILLRGASWQHLGLRAADPAWYRRIIPMALGLQVAVILTNALIALSIGKPFVNPQIELLTPDRLNWPAMTGMFLATTVFAPVAEEMALRGVLYGWLRQHVPAVAAGLVSATAFALLHGVPLLIPGTFLVGLTLAWVYEKSGSLLPGILLHGCFNAISTVLVFVAAANLDS